MSAFQSLPLAFAVSFLLPLAAAAQGFDGVYEYGYCSGEADAVALVIEGDTASYYETPCTLADAAPLADPEGAVQYTMACDYGSGPQPNTVVLFFNADGDLVMRSGDLEDRFVTCD